MTTPDDWNILIDRVGTMRKIGVIIPDVRVKSGQGRLNHPEQSSVGIRSGTVFREKVPGVFVSGLESCGEVAMMVDTVTGWKALELEKSKNEWRRANGGIGWRNIRVASSRIRRGLANLRAAEVGAARTKSTRRHIGYLSIRGFPLNRVRWVNSDSGLLHQGVEHRKGVHHGDVNKEVLTSQAKIGGANEILPVVLVFA